jgi:DNA-binding MarR family transcriptional regulator
MVDEKIPNERERIATMPQMCVNSHLRKATRIVSNFYDEIVRSTGLHSNQLMLLVPPYLAGPISISKMAEKIGLDRTTLVRNLKLIEEKGLVTITPGRDQRMRIVTLTSKGRDALIEFVPLWEAAQKQVIELLGSQHGELMSILGELSLLERDH